MEWYNDSDGGTLCFGILPSGNSFEDASRKRLEITFSPKGVLVQVYDGFNFLPTEAYHCDRVTPVKNPEGFRGLVKDALKKTSSLEGVLDLFQNSVHWRVEEDPINFYES
jgi:hypothetical protein